MAPGRASCAARRTTRPACGTRRCTVAGTPTAAYRRVFEAIDAMSADELERSAGRIEELAASNGLTFGVAGSQRAVPARPGAPDHCRRTNGRPWPKAWSSGPGPSRRSCATSTGRRASWPTVSSTPASSAPYRAGARRGACCPRTPCGAAVIGFDLVREPISGWRVLEDNVRVPSGVGYAVGMRRVLNAVVPELAMGVSIRAPEETIDLLGADPQGVRPGQHRRPGGGPRLRRGGKLRLVRAPDPGRGGRSVVGRTRGRHLRGGPCRW